MSTKEEDEADGLEIDVEGVVRVLKKDGEMTLSWDGEVDEGQDNVVVSRSKPGRGSIFAKKEGIIEAEKPMSQVLMSSDVGMMSSTPSRSAKASVGKVSGGFVATFCSDTDDPPTI